MPSSIAFTRSFSQADEKVVRTANTSPRLSYVPNAYSFGRVAAWSASESKAMLASRHSSMSSRVREAHGTSRRITRERQSSQPSVTHYLGSFREHLRVALCNLNTA
eukprot:TRINITY_DN122814_c0_g1_i1.p1 TRINITY_DN122814_c0_g1~~TRINITY_DN122814_c0_g1_i1.p1  ORF type:complete len:106 (-),score=4.64 TRINITY_DN122814_c0_g1_i1:18-335(-)